MDTGTHSLGPRILGSADPDSAWVPDEPAPDLVIPERPIPGALRELAGSIDLCERKLVGLIDRLDPILGPTLEVDYIEKDYPVGSSMLHDIQMAVARLERAIEVLTDRLEV